MFFRTFITSLLLAQVIIKVLGYPDGAPPESCQSMAVVHGVGAQENAAPFQIVPLEVNIYLYSWIRR